MARGKIPFAKWVERQSSVNKCSPRSTMCGAMRISECLAQYEKLQAFLRMPHAYFEDLFSESSVPRTDQNRCIWRIYIWEIWQFHGTCWMPGSGEHCHLLDDCEGFYHVSAARTGGPTVQPRSCEAGETPWTPQKTRMVTWNLKISLSKRNIIIQTTHFWVPYQFFWGVYNMLYFSACSNDFLSRLLPFTRRWRTFFGLQMTKKQCKSCLIKLDRFWHRNLSFSTRFNQFSKHCLYQTIRQALLVNHNSWSENHDLPTGSTSFICSHVCFPGIQSTNPFCILICITVSDRIKFKGFYFHHKEIHIRSVALPVIPSLSTPCWTDWHVIGLSIEIGIHRFVNVGRWGKHHMDMGNSQVAEWLMKCHSYWRPGINSWRSWNW